MNEATEEVGRLECAVQNTSNDVANANTMLTVLEQEKIFALNNQ